jgi:hypothetical protein
MNALMSPIKSARQARDPAFARVLCFEETCEALLDYATEGGQPYWLVVRWHLCRLAQDRTQQTETSALRFRRSQPFVRKLRLAAACAGDLAGAALRRGAAVVFVCTGGANMRETRGYAHRLVDRFAGCFPDDTLVLERPHELQYFRPRAYGRVGGWGGWQLLETLGGKVGRLSARQEERIGSFLALLQREFGDLADAGEWAWLRSLCVRFSRSEAIATAAYRWVLGRLRPKVLLLEDAHYGAAGHLILAARQLAIPVAEYQHGLVSLNHEAYNYAPGLLARGYARYLPDYFLAYGAYWGTCLSTSAKIVVIGNPNLAARLQEVPPGPAKHAGVLFVSSAMDSGRYIAVMTDLLRWGFHVVFRPHPIERPRLAQVYGDFFERNGIPVDLQPNALIALAGHAIIVGDISTALFEALALGRAVYAIEAPATATHVGDLLPTFSTAEQLRGLLQSPAAAAAGADEIWAGEWEQRYRAWIQEMAGLAAANLTS